MPYDLTTVQAPSASGPFQSIPGAGKAIDWTPAQAGNYFIKIDAIDRASHQTSSAVSGQALVLVTSALPDRSVDPLSKHAGMPITGGVKYLCTKWIREKRWVP